MKQNILPVFWGLLALFVAQPALAHSPIKGMGDFYNGLFHPVLVPAHCLLLVAFGLFVGQRGIYECRRAFGAFVVASVVGLVAAWFFQVSEMELLLLSAAAVFGLLIASRLSIGRLLPVLLAALAGLFVGLDSSQETLSGRAKFIAFLGNGLGIVLVLVCASAFADLFRRQPWQQVGLRVLGSWVAASAFLVLAFSYTRLA